ncbi:MAG TPA: SDR family NAD(P)-dependent oxidoreductase [Anaerolineales bacterium]|nr:SDR family NAD(P)-dependent oxidoreductase [Anaerolineales bacterium]
MRLQDRVAIITGGSRGIGRALARGLADEGARVAVVARTPGRVQTVAEALRVKGIEALGITCDVTQEDQVRSAVKQVLDTWGRIDVLVNNAGISGMRPIWGIPQASFDRTLAVNLGGTFLFTKHVWKPMQKAGGGSIINISSLGGVRGYPLLSAYCASKWGQIGFTLACAEEGKPDNIRVNAVAPGKADTDLRAQILEDKSKMLRPEDHIAVCVFLASDESRFITGQVIQLDWYGAEDPRDA